jgi:hypothetical protein
MNLRTAAFLLLRKIARETQIGDHDLVSSCSSWQDRYAPTAHSHLPVTLCSHHPSRASSNGSTQWEGGGRIDRADAVVDGQQQIAV